MLCGRVFISVIFLSAALVGEALPAEGLPTDDPTLPRFQETTKDYINRCFGRDLSHVENSLCYQDQIDALRKRVSSAYAASLKEAGNDKISIEIGGKSASERIRLKRSDLAGAQSAWKKYTDAHCGAVLRSTTLDGGNGGDLEYARCTIRHLVARLNEIK